MFDMIVVRGDIYADWVVATAYGWKIGAPVVTLGSDMTQNEILLKRYASMGAKSALIIGDPKVVPREVDVILENNGLHVERIMGLTRVETSINVAVYLWTNTSSIIVVNGWNESNYLDAIRYSRIYNAPVIFVKADELPNIFLTAVKRMPMLETAYVLGNDISSSVVSKIKDCNLKIIRLNATGNPPRGENRRFLMQSWILIIISFVLGLLSSIIFHKTRYKLIGKENIYSLLIRDERIVLDLILKNKGKIEQEKLSELTGFSKPKITRLITEMIERNLITRERFGKTYIIKISDQISPILTGS